MCILYILVCTHLLLAHDAPVKVKNLNGWSPLAEAISYGDRQTSMLHTECIESSFKVIFIFSMRATKKIETASQRTN